jgi:hypothetical protein
MFLAFMALLLFCGGAGVLVWLGLRRLGNHMRENPEAAKLVAEHVLAPMLWGKEKDKPEKPEKKTV